MTPSEEQTGFRGFRVQGKDRKPSSSPLPRRRVPEDSPLVFFRLSATFKKASLKTGRDEGSHSYALKYQLIFVYLNWDSCTIPTGTSAGCQLTVCDAAHHCITVFAPTCQEILQTDGMVASTHACSPPPLLPCEPCPSPAVRVGAAQPLIPTRSTSAQQPTEAPGPSLERCQLRPS
ncbi:hypothetical protein J1605_019028 [Eschrichtius robustus]|uniref:Uncharacterized protein n=1 Tax=Eschrichtius robustus TaxID=9764 RepID=A0AB34HUT3_ESCRO|nr:hypothetical protein J1605_019028 [Eschrichtius robustus]